MKRACMLLVPALLLLALAAGCQDDDKSLPRFTRLRVSPSCGVAPMDVEGYAIISGGNETGDPMGANNNLAISWDFGDGGTGSSTIAYHTFNTDTDTTYTVTVTGRDPDGNTTTMSVPVTVYTDSLAIQAGSDFPDGNVTTDQIIHFNIATESCDIDFPTVLGDSVKMVFKWEMGDAGNYQVYETDTPGNSIAVTGAALQPDNLTVVLTLASSASGISHTVQVDNVEDVSGNPIAPGTTRVIFEAAGAGATYESQGQTLVGLSNKVINHGQGPNLTPPLLVNAVLTDETTVTLTFNEDLDPVTAGKAGNHEFNIPAPEFRYDIPDQYEVKVSVFYPAWAVLREQTLTFNVTAP